jgi:hypothetical protein
MNKFEEKYPYFWLILGLILTLLSYGHFQYRHLCMDICHTIDTVYQQSNHGGHP